MPDNTGFYASQSDGIPPAPVLPYEAERMSRVPTTVGAEGLVNRMSSISCMSSTARRERSTKESLLGGLRLCAGIIVGLALADTVFFFVIYVLALMFLVVPGTARSTQGDVAGGIAFWLAVVVVVGALVAVIVWRVRRSPEQKRASHERRYRRWQKILRFFSGEPLRDIIHNDSTPDGMNVNLGDVMRGVSINGVPVDAIVYGAQKAKAGFDVARQQRGASGGASGGASVGASGGASGGASVGVPTGAAAAMLQTSWGAAPGGAGGQNNRYNQFDYYDLSGSTEYPQTSAQPGQFVPTTFSGQSYPPDSTGSTGMPPFQELDNLPYAGNTCAEGGSVAVLSLEDLTGRAQQCGHCVSADNRS